MFRASWLHTLRSVTSRRNGRRNYRQDRTLAIEVLRERITPAVTALFSPSVGLLTVFGDSLDNTVEVSRDAAGQIQVNGGAVAIRGGTPTVANTANIQIFGLGGSDNVSLNETNGALPRGSLFGGAGND